MQAKKWPVPGDSRRWTKTTLADLSAALMEKLEQTEREKASVDALLRIADRLSQGRGDTGRGVRP